MGTVDAPREARPMSLFKRSQSVVCAADNAMVERLRVVSSRGNLWQPSRSAASTLRKSDEGGV